MYSCEADPQIGFTQGREHEMESTHFASVVGALADGAVGRGKQLGVAGVAVAQRVEERLRPAIGLLHALEIAGQMAVWGTKLKRTQPCCLRMDQSAALHRGGVPALIGSGERGPEDAVGNQREQRRVDLADHSAALEG